jgi:hypothetical protein
MKIGPTVHTQVFLCDSGLMGEIFGYTHCKCSGWERYMTSENLCNTNLFLNNSTKMATLSEIVAS